MIHRKKKKKGFTQIDNQMLKATNLSFGAKGLLCYLLSFPMDWKPKPKTIAKETGQSRHIVYALFNELKEKGYAEFKRIRSQDGQFVKAEWHIYEAIPECVPHPEIPDMVIPDTVLPDMVNRYTTNTIITNTLNNTNTHTTNMAVCDMLKKVLNRKTVGTSLKQIKKHTTENQDKIYHALEKLQKLQKQIDIRNPLGFLIASWDGEDFNIVVTEKENKLNIFNELLEEVTALGKKISRAKHKKKFLPKLKKLQNSRYPLIVSKANELINLIGKYEDGK